MTYIVIFSSENITFILRITGTMVHDRIPLYAVTRKLLLPWYNHTMTLIMEVSKL